MNPYDVIIRPVMTEKTAGLMEEGNKVVFRVRKEANKNQIRDAVEQLFGVKVSSVNTIKMPGREKRQGRFVGRRNGYKKAVITLADGQVLDLFAMEGTEEEGVA